MTTTTLEEWVLRVSTQDPRQLRGPHQHNILIFSQLSFSAVISWGTQTVKGSHISNSDWFINGNADLKNKEKIDSTKKIALILKFWISADEVKRLWFYFKQFNWFHIQWTMMTKLLRLKSRFKQNKRIKSFMLCKFVLNVHQLSV